MVDITGDDEDAAAIGSALAHACSAHVLAGTCVFGQAAVHGHGRGCSLWVNGGVLLHTAVQLKVAPQRFPIHLQCKQMWDLISVTTPAWRRLATVPHRA
jgi:hypothetical protein